MTTLHWDHTVHYVNDLENAIEMFKENGLIAFKGGSHKQWGTYNALSYFGLTYIEFLAIENRELVVKADPSNVVVKDAIKMLPANEAFSRVAIRTDDIEDTAATLKANGLKLSPIIDGKRLNTLGQLIEWRMMTIEGDFQGLVYPFVIQWKGSDEDRLENLTASGIIQPHSAGDVSLDQAVFHVQDPAAVAAHWQMLFGLSVIETSDSSVTLGISGKSFIFKQGAANQLTQLVFNTDANDLKGKTIKIGEAEYVF
ncbi:VOC family protein [Bacillus canaveralius]|uniref:VOC family protein n=1 Tax=Bacillus canaveralius TaxID=1403243 RepID=UPI000F7BAD81|nr:VOC family protein [Bacillus canaveralius]RSK54631.1 VOC family protein [Bacillus canaveralius]